ncbi:MAG: copper amine oxidase N-terminal domain-containing protein [Clostridia bacterium]|nr:copper amine oxidase N-terminal domain-containing protein [Clostridia bacterium]
MSIWSIIDDRFITVYDDGYTGLYQIDGTPIILPDYYDEISYCKELDIFAFGKDLQVSIAKLTPATPATPTISVDVYGKPVEFDQPPVLKDGRTLVPVRAISEALGASVDWDEATQTVTATLGDTVVKLVINSNRMLVNDKVIEIDVPAEIINSRTLIPVRAISEAFGCQVDWDDDNYRVIIS